jgi:hypothetical protein
MFLHNGRTCSLGKSASFAAMCFMGDYAEMITVACTVSTAHFRCASSRKNIAKNITELKKTSTAPHNFRKIWFVMSWNNISRMVPDKSNARPRSAIAPEKQVFSRDHRNRARNAIEYTPLRSL